MKVEEFRTKAFRDKVEYIVKQRGHDTILHKNRNKLIHYNFDNNSNTKALSFCGTPVENCVAYYWTKSGDISGEASCPVHYIQYSEVVKLERKLKLAKIGGNEIQIAVKKVKKVVTPKINLEVGEFYVLTDCRSSEIVKIIGKTDKQFKYQLYACSYKDPKYSKQIKEGLESQNGYNISVPISEMNIEHCLMGVAEYGGAKRLGTLRLNKLGDWRSGSDHISTSNKYSEYWYSS
jgi:hypothetical protein